VARRVSSSSWFALTRVLVPAAVVWLVPSSAHGCDCRRLPEPSPAIAAEARFLFAGRVVEISERSEHVTITRDGAAETSVRPLEKSVVFHVSQAWRGVRGPAFTVATDWSDCGYPFQPGREYLVFAEGTGSTPPSTSICLRTTPLEQAEAPPEASGADAVIRPLVVTSISATSGGASRGEMFSREERVTRTS
jgi:hypothetical protein